MVVIRFPGLSCCSAVVYGDVGGIGMSLLVDAGVFRYVAKGEDLEVQAYAV